MFCFQIYVRSNSSGGPNEKNRSATYVTRIDQRDSFKGNVNRDSRCVLASRFDSLCGKFGDFDIIQSNQGGLRRIEAKDTLTGGRLGEIHGNRILSNGEVILIERIGPTDPTANSVGQKKMYSFRRKSDDCEIGWIETPSSQSNVGMVRRLFNRLEINRSGAVPVWEGQLNSTEIDFRLVITTSVLLHVD